MYFEISQNLIDNLSKKDFENLNILIDSYRYGNHILALEKRAFANSLNEYFSKNEENKKIIRHIYSNHQDNKSLQRKLNTYVKITSSTSKFSKYINNNVQIFKVPLSYFDDQLLCPTLITENTADGTFYKGLMNRIQEDEIFNIPKNILFKCTNDSGGGSQIADVFKHKITVEKRLAFSICDSDKNEQEGSIGGTSKALKKTYDKLSLNEEICSIFIINVREKENLVPPSYYYKHNDFKNKTGLLELSKLEHDVTCNEKIRYLKISGVCPQTLSYLNDELDLSMAHTDYTIGKNGLEILSKEFIYTESYLEQIKANSKRIESGEYLNQYTTFFDNLPDYLCEEYKRIAHFFLDWTCAYSKPRIAN